MALFSFKRPGRSRPRVSHIIGCLITGAKIKKVVLLSKEGGMVSYAQPALPVIGNVIISTAPLFFLPLVLAALTWLFRTYAGCTFSVGNTGRLTLPAAVYLSDINDRTDPVPEPFCCIQRLVYSLPVSCQ